MKLQLKRSNVLESGAAKEPTSSQLEYGELAINYNTTDPAIFLKDSNNNVIRISGIGNIADDGQVELPASTTPPLNPLPGNLWFNSDDGRLYIYYADADSEQWVDASPDSWDPSSYPDVSDDDSQAGTLDDRYLMLNSANSPVTGDLQIDGTLGINYPASSKLTVKSVNQTNPSLTYNNADMFTFGDNSQQLSMGRGTGDFQIIWMQARASNNTARDIALNPIGGDVGIGTSKPSSKLHISSDNAGSALRLSHTDITSYYSFGRDSSNNLRINDSANGEIIRITSNGNVGIGADNPAEMLDVSGNLKVGASSGVAEIYSNLPELRIGSDKNDNNSPSVTTFYVDNEEKVRIDNNGDVGIGTNDPQTKLYVLEDDPTDGILLTLDNNVNAAGTKSGISFLQNSSDSVRCNLLSDRSGANAGVDFKIELSDNTGALQERFRIKEGGNVGIGTDAPSQALEVVGSVKASEQFIGPTATQGSSETSPTYTFSGQQTGMFLPASNVLGFSTDGSEKLRINSNGYVGIGTTDPKVALDVNGNLLCETSTVCNITMTANVGNGNDSTLVFKKSRNGVDIQNGDDLGTITWNGYYDGSYQNSGSIKAEAILDGSYSFRMMFDSDEFYIRTSNSTRLYIDETGDVGIGTTATKSKLTVAGDVSASNYRFGDSTNPDTSGTLGNDTVAGYMQLWGTNTPQDGAVLFGTAAGSTGEIARFNQHGLTFERNNAAANALDDYEEGLWTPEYIGSTANPTVAYDQQDGSYTKIGRLVTCIVRLRTDSVAGGSGNLRLGNLPFLVNNTHSARGSVTVGLAGNFGVKVPTRGIVRHNARYLDFYANGATNLDSNLLMAVADLGTGVNANNVYLTFSYLTAT